MQTEIPAPDLRALLEETPDLIARFDTDARYLYVNPALARAARTTAAELFGTEIGEQYAAKTGRPVPEGLLALRRAVREVARTGIATEVETTIRWDDQVRIYRARLIPERDLSGRVIGVLNHGHDITEGKRSEETRRRLLARLILVREDERRALARELHDGIGQAVTALAYGTESVLHAPTLKEARRHAEHLREVAQETLEGLRRLAHGLHPRVLEDLGLEAAVERRATDFISTFGIAVDVAVSGAREPRLQREIEASLYRVFTEALTNVARHSGASRASVVLRRDDGHVDLIIEDDGAGFDAPALLQDERAEAFGLRGIMENASLLGGTARIEAAPGRGTTVAVRMPT